MHFVGTLALALTTSRSDFARPCVIRTRPQACLIDHARDRGPARSGQGQSLLLFQEQAGILFHCHVKCIAISLTALDEVLAQKLPPADSLRSLLVRHIRNITEDAYSGVLLTDLESLTPVQRKRYVAMRDRFEQGVRKMICDGIAEGTFAKQDVDLAGFTILGAINWIPKWYRRDGALPPLRSPTGRRSVDPLIATMTSSAVANRRGVRGTLEDSNRCSFSLLFRRYRGCPSYPLRRRIRQRDSVREAACAWPPVGRAHCAWRIECPRAARRLCLCGTGVPVSKAGRVGDTVRPRFTVENIWQEGERCFSGSRRHCSTRETRPCWRAFAYIVSCNARHQRRRTNIQRPRPITGGKSWPPQYTYVPALRVGNMVWLSGTTGTDDNGKITAPGDIIGQTRQMFASSRSFSIQSAERAMTLCKRTTFSSRPRTIRARPVRREFFKTSYPTSTGVLVSGLLRKDALIEISAMAVLRGD